MAHRLTINSITPVGGTVFQYDLEKPENFSFKPGQATDVAIDKDDWREETRPFTFTSLPDWDKLQFTIKSYPDHDGVTKQLMNLSPGDRLIIDDPWGTIQFKGKGVFIAGGAGMTPFLSILRDLRESGELAGNRLFFANKTVTDIFCKDEIDGMSGLAVHHVLSEEDRPGYLHGIIDEDFLKQHVSDFNQKFYVCGPPEMVKSVKQALKSLGANAEEVVFEE
ncbi:FAD-binding oxidoreductase [Rhizobium sp. L1K21]|uniref:FAD-binding oxidoreductase n=1 Tax=Rhizobium sp. L1K21 TaxID=2954933 RepID=UPI002092D09E|nr:FAD-binding oxidoreductase [Rhizobium sp. L1K21]MCO6188133.1 FAD-binding oxidoreductase [Rhizobium sp. L1K21]